MKERWKPVAKDGFSDYYEVSNLGNVRRISGPTYTGRYREGRILSPAISRGYKMVIMHAYGEKHFDAIHRLVANAFLTKPLGNKTAYYFQVNHKNGNKLDNRLCNLQWCTPKENMRHAVANGLTKIGERHANSKLTEANIREIRLLHGTMPLKKIASKFSVGVSTISRVMAGINWSHVV